MDLRYIFPDFTEDQFEVLTAVTSPNEENVDFSLDAQQECDVLVPVDETTGNRPNILNKIVDESLNPLERDRLASTLQRMPVSRHGKMSDRDLIDTTPSRYNQTLTDNEKFAGHLSGLVDEDVSDKPDGAEGPSPAGTPSGSPDSPDVNS